MKLIVFILIAQACLTWSAQACPFPTYAAVEAQPDSNAGTRESLDQRPRMLKEAFANDVQIIYEIYKQGKLRPSDFASCPRNSSDFKRRLERDFSNLFLLAAARDIETHGPRAAIPFAELAAKDLGATSLTPTQVILDPARPRRGREAGYDRETRGLYFRIFEIAPSDWRLYFFHEFAHAFDDRIRQGVRDYAAPAIVKPAIEIIRANPKKASPAQTETLIRYLRAGAERGLFAEFRAWVVSSHLAGTGQTPVEALKRTWWARLKKSFIIPNEGIFLHPLMRQAHQVMIDRVDPLTEDFGDLAQFLK